MKDTEKLANELASNTMRFVVYSVIGTLLGVWIKLFWLGWVFKEVIMCID